MGAIGMNEIMSIPTGILACDAMLKAAEVELGRIEGELKAKLLEIAR